MKTLLEKIVEIAKIEGFESITENNWSKIRNSYQITFSWNAVLEANRVLKDFDTLSRMFPPKLAKEIFEFCKNFKNESKAESLETDKLCNMDINSSSFNETSFTKSVIEEEGQDCLRLRTDSNEEKGVKYNTSQESPVGNLNSTPSTSALHHDFQNFKRFKRLSIPSWETNLPASSSSAPKYGNLHSNRNLTSAEWKTCLAFANRNGMLPYILGIDFWDRLKSGVKNEVPIAKSAKQLKCEFFTNVIPNRHSYAENLIPRLKLRPSDPESLLTVFYEIKNMEHVTTPIETLVSDGILSDVLDWEGWLHMFIEALFNKIDSYWMASILDIQHVKKLNLEYFFERVAPKLAGDKAMILQHAINEIALDLRPAVSNETTVGNEPNVVSKRTVSDEPNNNNSSPPNVIETDFATNVKETTHVKNTDSIKVLSDINHMYNVKQTNDVTNVYYAANANGISNIKETVNKNKTTNLIEATNRNDLGPTKQKVHTKNYYKERSSLKESHKFVFKVAFENAYEAKSLRHLAWIICNESECNFSFPNVRHLLASKTGDKQNRSALQNIFEAVKTMIDDKEGRDFYEDLKNLLDKQEKGDS